MGTITLLQYSTWCIYCRNITNGS